MAIPLDRIDDVPLGASLAVDRMPAHWLMAQLGKRVLRPGGRETTAWLLAHSRIGGTDDVVELAPGLGTTARLILARRPRSYTGVERDTRAASFAERALAGAEGTTVHIVRADAASVPLADGSATVVIGEAMLSMQPAAKKLAIIREAHRLLGQGGRYLIHELALQPDGIDAALYDRIQQDLSSTIHVGVRIGTRADWQSWFAEAGFDVERATTAPMRLLEPGRMLRDEGPFGMARFVFNALRTPGAAQRLKAVRQMFRRHRDHLCAIGLVLQRRARDV